MKYNSVRTIRGIMLGIAMLFAAVPFAVQAQSKVAAAPEKETEDSAGAKEITLTIEGTIRGGRFFFKEKTIQFDTLNKYEWPEKDIYVNGKPWSDPAKPFKLDFTPDFAKAVILEKSGGPDGGRVYVLPREKMFALMIVPREKDPEAVPFRVRLAVKNQAAHRDLPPDETPPESGTPKRAAVIAPRRVQSTSGAAEERVTLVLAGKIEGKGKFQLQSNRIEYLPDSQSNPSYPDDVTVNGKPWEDVHVPFDLDFLIDYTTGKVTDRSGTATVIWRAIPVGDSVFDRYEHSVGELFVTGEGKGDASSFRAAVSLQRFPQDYAARIIAVLNDGREKRRKGELDSAYMANEGELSPDDRKQVEKWRADRQKDQLLWTSDRSYTTDGKELPYLTRAAVAAARDLLPDQFDITIEAVVNCGAVFSFMGDKIVCSDQSYPNEGKYPAKVTVNGKSWRNLHQPFTLESEIDPDFVVGMNVETEYYRYYLAPERNRITLGIVNHGPRDEEQVRIRLSLRKKNAGPANRK